MKIRASVVPGVRLAVLLYVSGCFGLQPTAPLAAPREAEQRVEDALARYEAGDYAAAAEAFAQAEAALPEDPRILFDLGVALTAKGDTEQAEVVLQRAATSADREVVVRARYNLGCLAADKARALFGNRPEEASPAVRQRGMDLLDQASGQFRDCLRLDENHEDARHNLEVIRLWTVRMRDTWSLRDRQKRPGPTTPDKPPPKTTPSQPPPKQGPGQEGNEGEGTRKGDEKRADLGMLADDKGQPPGDERQKTPEKNQGVSLRPTAGEMAQERAERLFSKVRQRSQVKVLFDKERQPNRPEERQEKDW